MLVNILRISFVLSVTLMVLVFAKNTYLIKKGLLDGISSQTASESTFLPVGQNFYYFSDKKVSWYYALLECRIFGGVLASIETLSELNVLSNYLREKSDVDQLWWLSGSNAHSKEEFASYGTGNPMPFIDWFPEQPNDYKNQTLCSLLRYREEKHQIYAWVCDEQAYYICQTKKPAALVTVLT